MPTAKKSRNSKNKSSTKKRPSTKTVKVKVNRKPVTKKNGPSVKEMHHVIILDRSSSMLPVRDATIGGYNENASKIRDLAKNNKIKHSVTLVTFSDLNTNVSWLQPIKDLSDLSHDNYAPSGCTALCDAMGRTITRLNDELVKKASKKNPINVLLTVITDGEENASKEYTAQKVSDLIESLKANKNLVWTIAYMGANHDVLDAAKKLNISAANTVSYNSDIKGTKSAFLRHSTSRDAYAQSLSKGANLGFAANSFFSPDPNNP